jgi:integrase
LASVAAAAIRCPDPWQQSQSCIGASSASRNRRDAKRPPGRPYFAPPKTRRGYRTIALSPLVADTVAAHLAAFGPGEDGLVFHFEGRAISRAMLAKHIRTATRTAAMTATWHDLRHHHASVLLSAGVSPALVAERLGHDLKTLLHTYAHVIRTDEERVRAIVDESLGGSAEDWLRTKRTG